MPSFSCDQSTVTVSRVFSVTALPKLRMVVYRKFWISFSFHLIHNLLWQIFLLFCFFDHCVFFVYCFCQRRITFDKLNYTICLTFMICRFRNEQYSVGVMGI